MFDKMAKRMVGPINTAGVSILGAFNVLLGAWVLLPFDSLGVSDMLPEWIIALGLIIIGLFITVGSINERYRLLTIGSNASFYYWFLSTVGALLVSWQNTAWIFSAMIACYSAFVAVNFKVNHKNLPFKKV